MKRIPQAALDNIPRFTITVTDDSCWLTRHNTQGKPYLTYPVSSQSLGAAFNGFEADTGLLPPDCLFWQNQSGRNRVGIWIPPAIRKLNFACKRGKPNAITIPLPGFVFVGDGPRYYIYAAKERPASASDMLYHAPLPNVHDNGEICAGSVKFPECEPGAIAEAARLFFESEFNGDLASGKVKGQRDSLFNTLKSLTGARKFPLRNMIYSGPLSNVLGKNKGAQTHA